MEDYTTAIEAYGAAAKRGDAAAMASLGQVLLAEGISYQAVPDMVIKRRWIFWRICWLMVNPNCWQPGRMLEKQVNPWRNQLLK